MNNELKQARIESNLSVSELAVKVGISQSFYYKIQSGLRNPSMKLAKRIADALEKKVDELFFKNEMDDMSSLDIEKDTA